MKIGRREWLENLLKRERQYFQHYTPYVSQGKPNQVMFKFASKEYKKIGLPENIH